MDFLPAQGKKMRHSWATLMFFNEELVEKAQKVWGITFGHLLKCFVVDINQELPIYLSDPAPYLPKQGERILIFAKIINK